MCLEHWRLKLFPSKISLTNDCFSVTLHVIKLQFQPLWSWVTNFPTTPAHPKAADDKKAFHYHENRLLLDSEHEMKKRNMIRDWKLLSIYACKSGKKIVKLTLAMLFKAHLSSIWRIFFSCHEKMPNDDNGPDVHTAINNEVLHKKLSPTFL